MAQTTPGRSANATIDRAGGARDHFGAGHDDLASKAGVGAYRRHDMRDDAFAKSATSRDECWVVNPVVSAMVERWNHSATVSPCGVVQISYSIGLALDELIKVLVRSAEVDIALARVLRDETDLMARGLHNRSG